MHARFFVFPYKHASYALQILGAKCLQQWFFCHPSQTFRSSEMAHYELWLKYCSRKMYGKRSEEVKNTLGGWTKVITKSRILKVLEQYSV